MVSGTAAASSSRKDSKGTRSAMKVLTLLDPRGPQGPQVYERSRFRRMPHVILRAREAAWIELLEPERVDYVSPAPSNPARRFLVPIGPTLSFRPRRRGLEIVVDSAPIARWRRAGSYSGTCRSIPEARYTRAAECGDAEPAPHPRGSTLCVARGESLMMA